MHAGAFAWVDLRLPEPGLAALAASSLQSCVRAASQSFALVKPHVDEIWHSACAFEVQKLVTSGYGAALFDEQPLVVTADAAAETMTMAVRRAPGSDWPRRMFFIA